MGHLVDRGHELTGVSEAEACRWLGRRVCLDTEEPLPTFTGRLQHVSSRNVFLLEDGANADLFGGTIRLVPLARIARIEQVTA